MTFQEIDGHKRLALNVPGLIAWYLDTLEMAPVELSEHLQVSRQAIYTKMNRASSLSQEELETMASLFRQILGKDQFFWAQVQRLAT